MHHDPRSFPRRRALGVLRGLALSPLAARVPPARAHGLLGPVTPPAPLPAMTVTRHDGRRQPLAALLQGRVTALQLMFTGCSSVCPLQGAQFAELQRRLGGDLGRRLGLLSVSIDAPGDDAPALRRWRERHGAGPAWVAAVPDPADVDRLPALLRGRIADADRHSAQTFVIDRSGRLTYRCAELAPAEAIADILRQLTA
ncbi:MAG: hypothetical protein RL456_2038 [Pseudomonadota bacterium]|jgi:protein SCO1/2